MKKNTNKTRNIITGLFIFLAVGFSSTVNAAAPVDGNISISFIGKIKNLPSFQLNINNSEEGEYSIVVRGNSNETIFAEKLKGVEISRKYSFQTGNDELYPQDFTLTFEVTSSKTGKTQIYRVTPKTEVLHSFDVAKYK